MATQLNNKGFQNAKKLIKAGDVDRTSDWSFDAEDGNKLLGDNGDDWENYAKWFLGEDTAENEQTKARYKYPFGKNGKVYRSAITAIRQRAGQQGDDDIFNAAGELIDMIDANEEGKKSLDLSQFLTTRTLQIENRLIRAEGDNQVIDSVSFSSEKPAVQWFGIEILSHAPDAIILDRAKYGLPLLMDHNIQDQRGRAENIKIENNRLVGSLRFSKNQSGQELLQDIIDGIRREVSIGYEIKHHKELTSEEMDDETRTLSLEYKMPVYFVDKWELLEVSSVSIPADISVGVGRGMELKEFYSRDFKNNNSATQIVGGEQSQKTKGVITMDTTKNAPTEEELLKRERDRVAAIEETSQKFVGRLENIDEMKRNAIKAGTSIEEFRGAIAMALADEPEPIFTPPSKVGMSEKEQKDYSLLRVIQAQIKDSGVKADFEREVSDEIAKNLGKPARGFYVPWEIQNRRYGFSQNQKTYAKELSRKLGIPYQRALSIVYDDDPGQQISGSALIGTTLVAGGFIEYLRARSIAAKIGVQMMFGLTSDIAFPRQTKGAVFNWFGEGVPDETAQDVEFDQVVLSPKEGSCGMEYTRKALLQSTPGLNEIITNDLLNAARMGIEHAMFFGDEDSYTTQPRGIINEENIGAIDDATTNWGKIVQLEAAVASANADVDTMYYVMSPAVRGVLKSDQKFSGAGVVAEPIMREDQLLNGYSTAVSTILKPDLPLLDKYLIFGDFSQELLGYFGNIDVLVNPYVGDTSRIIRVTVAADVSCRLRNPGAIAVDNSIELPTP